MKNSNLFKVLSILLLMCPMFSSAMETKQSDFQIYQLLSYVTKNNPQFHLPADLVQTITTTACKITENEKHQCIATLNKAHALMKKVNEQNQQLLRLTNETHTLINELNDLEAENNYLRTLIKKQENLTDETDFLAGYFCSIQ